MVAFPDKTWADGSAGGTPISAAALNDLEQRIKAALAAVSTGGSGAGTVTSINGIAPGGDGNVVLTAGSVGARPDSYTPSIGDLPAGLMYFAVWSDSRKDARPTARTDVKVWWFVSGSTQPPIVSSGTGGMLNNVDEQVPS